MFRKWQFYMGANDYVEMTEGMDSSMLASLGQRRRRRFLSLVALVMALLILAPWLAWNPAAFQWLSRVAPPVARFLRPDTGSREENGIRVELVEVSREGNRLLVHLTLEDLEGDRLNGTSYPEWWSCEQGRGRTSDLFTREYDEETGLLHLYLTCEPEKDISDYDWERWSMVTIGSLRNTSDSVPDPITIPLDQPAETPIPIQEGRTITSMTAANMIFRVQVKEVADPDSHSCRLYLQGPNGELLRHYHQSDADGITTWNFYLGDRDIREFTLVADLDPICTIEGPWCIHVKPIADK